ncbi:MAG TPA: aldehyde:ferredoxin oxidoreductase [Chloroflexi bacterium]|nr:aldehyde:ferredoxin oxidoreductase [Chloroflexota bacterium]
MYAYTGRILHVDLGRRTSYVEEVEPEYLRRYLGGVGLATRLLVDNAEPGCDPLGEGNCVAVAVGAFAGTVVPCGGKHAMAAKSPLTGFIGDSLSGSYWSNALRRAGYDGLVITGRAAEPTYLLLDDRYVLFRDAKELWGRGGFETEEAIRQEIGDSSVRVASIGVAGENLVRYACVSNDRGRQAGRTGLGAVWGSKNLKAIAVRGNQPVSVADLAELNKLSMDFAKRAQGVSTAKYRLTGTVGNVLTLNRLGLLPTRNMRNSAFEAAEEVSGEYLQSHFKEKTVACSGCPIACEQVARVREGPYAGTRVSLDYETLYALGPCCGIGAFPTILKAAELCDRYGLDTISTGVTIAWAMECFERGIFTESDTGGLALQFGNGDASVALIERIAARDGLGDLLAQGTKLASEQVGQGSEQFAMQSKGLELPGYEPRGLKTYALGLAVGTRGACHNRSLAYEPDMKGVVDRLKAEKGRGRVAMDCEDLAAVLDCLMFCKFIRGCFDDFYQDAVEFYRLSTGLDLTSDELRQAGERACNLKKYFNIREGWTKDDDWLPARILDEPLPDGGDQGTTLTAEELRLMIDDYYQARGWTEEGLIPAEKLVELGLEDLVEKARQ